MHNPVISTAAIIIYCTAGFLLAWRLFGRKEADPTSPLKNKWGLILLGMVAVLLHGLELYHNMLTPSGINLGLFNAVSLISWLIALTVLLGAITNPVESLGIVLLPFAAISLALSLFIPVNHTLLPAEATELKFHILLSILAYSLLSIAAVQAIILAAQDKQLRNRKPGGFIRALPPLQTMENLLFQMIGLGFFLHSLSLITGLIYIDDMFAQHIVHKTVLSIVAWFIFAILLWGRWRFGWRGMTAIRWTLGGFIALALAYVGSKWVLEVILSR